MKAHVSVDAQSGLMHTVADTAANANDLNMAGARCAAPRKPPLETRATRVCASEPRPPGRYGTSRCTPGKRKKLNPFIEPDFGTERVEKVKASIRQEQLSDSDHSR